MKLKLLTTTLFTFAGVIFFSLNSTPISAATRTWDGSAGANFSNPANWDAAIADGDDLIFPGGVGNFQPNNDIVGLDVNSITITGAGYIIGGNQITLADSIDNQADVNNISLDVQLSADVVINSTDDFLAVDSDINLNSFTLTVDTEIGVDLNNVVSGNGDIEMIGIGRLSFYSSNTFVGSLTSNNGEIYLGSENSTGNASNTITIGDGVVSATLTNGPDDDCVTPGSNVQISESAEWNMDTSTIHINHLTGDGSINTDTGELRIGNGTGDFEFGGNFEGNSIIVKEGTNTMTLSGDSSNYEGALNLSSGTLIVNGDMSQTFVLMIDGTLKGSGTIGSILASAGTIAPGNSPGILSFAGDVTLDPNVTYAIEINGATVGTQYDQLDAAGFVDLADSTLSISLGYTPTIGTSFIIINADGGVIGEFNGLPNFSSIVLGGTEFIIEYGANDVTLTAVGTLFNPSFTATPNPAVVGSTVTITSTWTGTAGTPTGTAELFDGSTSLGTVSLVSGVATFSISTLGVGVHSLTVIYSGDGSYNGAISNPLSLTITSALAVTGTQVPVGLLGIGLMFSLGVFLLLKKRQD